MENQKEEKIINDNNKDNKNINKENNILNDNEPLIKEVNNIQQTENKTEIKSITKEKINELLSKDKKLKDIYQLINSPIISPKKYNMNNLSYNLYYNSNRKSYSNLNNKKYKDLYEQINIIDSINETNKNKPLIPYSTYKKPKSNFETIKRNQEIKSFKSFTKNRKNNIFSDLKLPEKTNWASNSLFKSSNVFYYNKSKKDFFDLGNSKSQINFGKEESKLNNYYKKELNFFSEMLRKGNSTNLVLNTPKTKGSFLETDFKKNLEKKNTLDKLKEW